MPFCVLASPIALVTPPLLKMACKGLVELARRRFADVNDGPAALTDDVDARGATQAAHPFGIRLASIANGSVYEPGVPQSDRIRIGWHPILDREVRPRVEVGPRI